LAAKLKRWGWASVYDQEPLGPQVGGGARR